MNSGEIPKLKSLKSDDYVVRADALNDEGFSIIRVI